MVQLKPDGGMRLNLHAGQLRAWNSKKRFIAVIAGTQSGKTSFGPHWFAREIQREGPGDYMVVTPTFPLLEIKALPEFRRLFEQQLQWGTYKASPIRQFRFSTEGEVAAFGAPQDVPTNVYFGYAADPESLESATLKAIWGDEVGQGKFKLASWDALQRRIALHRGRALLTTTPYNLGWLKQQMFDPWKAAVDEGGDHPAIDVINFASNANPMFDQEQFEEARATMPRWKFDLFYLGIFTKPAGLIYDRFDPVHHVLPADYAIQPWWRRVAGVDFGGVNTAVIVGAMEQDDQQIETGRLVWYREYLAGGRTAAQHVAAILADMPLQADGTPVVPQAFGGSGSEQQWRNEWASAGLPIYEPVITGTNSVEIGIDRVYGAHAAGRILVMPTLTRYLEQKNTYSRKVDAAGEPTEEIEDKSTFHFMDAERYLVSWLLPPAGQWGML